MDSFNANFKKQRENVANQVSNKAKNTNHNLNIEGLINLRKLHTNNPIIGYLNTNSLGNKITQLRKVCRKASIDFLCIDETKPDASFPDDQFHIEGCQYPPFRRDRDKNGEGKMIFITEGLAAKRLYVYKDSTSETMCLEVTISKKKYYLNVLVVGDLNIDTLDQKKIQKITYVTYVILSRSQVSYRELHA